MGVARDRTLTPMNRRPLLLGSILAAALPWPARADEDAEGSADHPAIARFPGFYIDDFKGHDFNRHEFPTGDNAAGDRQFAGREGRFLQNVYALKTGARRPSAVELIRNFEVAFRQAGGQMVWSSVDEGQATYRLRDRGGERWMHIEIGNQGAWMRQTVVDVQAMQQKVEVSASDMLQALDRDGFIALRGIEFNTGQDTLRPESEPLLNEVLNLLKGAATLRLSIEGHTDNVGAASANLSLSRRRAERVKAWLVGQGVPAARLATQGFGDTKPVADNRTEEGRSRNRRVELVKLK